jgi:hypothetical protein
MLCGHLSVSERVEQISVPPAKTATIIPPPERWRHEVLNIGGGRRDLPVRLRLGGFDSAGLSAEDSLEHLRGLLDRLYDFGETYTDGNGVQVPQVMLELRIDADVPWGTVQQVEQVLADTIDPLTGEPRRGSRPFVHLTFSARDPADG